MNEKVVHFKGLNGIRAIAALAVVFAHTTHELSVFGFAPAILSMGGFGVSVFFSLSGFLITYLLLLEKEKTPINIKNFYIRRILRIQPLYFAYLFLSLATIIFFNLEYSKTSIPYYFLLAANIPYILGAALPFLVHYWTLGVEEQFYIFYPWIVKKADRLLPRLIQITVFLFLLKSFFWFIDIKYGISLPYKFAQDTRFQCMLIGAIGAVYFYNKSEWFLRISTNKTIQIISWLIIALVGLNYFHFASVLDNEFVSLITVFLIVGQITQTNRIINLDLAGFDFLGRISYGIYVIHPLIIFFTSKFLVNIDLPILIKSFILYVAVFGLTILIAYLSYEFFEKRFLRLASNYRTISNSPTKHFDSDANAPGKSS